MANPLLGGLGGLGGIGGLNPADLAGMGGGMNPADMAGMGIGKNSPLPKGLSGKLGANGAIPVEFQAQLDSAKALEAARQKALKLDGFAAPQERTAASLNRSRGTPFKDQIIGQWLHSADAPRKIKENEMRKVLAGEPGANVNEVLFKGQQEQVAFKLAKRVTTVTVQSLREMFQMQIG